MTTRQIVVTDSDMTRLRGFAALSNAPLTRDSEHLRSLTAELERALVVESDEVPSDVVTMHTTVVVRDLQTGESSEYTLVYPQDADLEARRVSVLAPLGTALLGYREDDEIVWEMPGGTRRLRIERVHGQPEAFRRSNPGVLSAQPARFGAGGAAAARQQAFT